MIVNIKVDYKHDHTQSIFGESNGQKRKTVEITSHVPHATSFAKG